jgi:hypothetical protein
MPEIKEPSQRKRDAASANGKLARGSKTPEGKARSAMNAVTHGFTAATVILAGEDRGAFERLLAAYAERFQPADAVEMDMLQDIVIAKWRHRRGAAFEAATIDDEVESQRADTYRRRSESTSELTRSALAYRDVEDRTGIISAMNRHQGRQYREYRQAIRLLVEFQRDRPPNEKVHNEASPTNGHLENGAPIQSEPLSAPDAAAPTACELLDVHAHGVRAHAIDGHHHINLAAAAQPECQPGIHLVETRHFRLRTGIEHRNGHSSDGHHNVR